MTRLELPNVTAICIDGRPADIARNEHYRLILDYMMSTIKFGAVKLLLCEDPQIHGVDFVKIDPIESLGEYSDFCLQNLHKYVDTDWCLIFQDDGFVLHPELWKTIFFEYDYIGAPWPPRPDWPEPNRPDRRVGNGGFSLRSKRLLEFTKNFKVEGRAEDVVISVEKRDLIESAGLRIAPVHVALDFSIETAFVESQSMFTCFGFHHKARVADAIWIIKDKQRAYSTPNIV